jgi:Domain of Unknown Function (DUF748)
MPDRRPSRAARRGARTALFVASVAVAAWLALPTAGAALLGWMLTRASGQPVEIGRLAIGLRPFAVDLGDVRVTSVYPGRPLLRAARVRIESRPAALFRKQLRLRRVDVERGWVDGAVTHGAAAWRWTSLRIGELHVTDGHVRRLARRTMHLHDLAASSVAVWGGRGPTALRFRGDVEGGRFRGRRDARGLRLAVEASGLGLRPFAALLPAGVRSGSATGHASYRRSADASSERLDGDLGIGRLRLADRSGWRARLGAVRLAGLHADLRRGRMRMRALAMRDGGIDASRAAPPGWRGAVDVLSLARVRIRPEGWPALDAVGLVARGVSTAGPAATVAARASVGGSGHVRARGTIDVTRPAVEGRVKLDGVELAALLAPIPAGLGVSGTVSGAFDVSGPPVILSHGALGLDDVSLTVDGEPIAGWQRLATDVAHFTLAPRHAAFGNAVVDAPYLVLRRDAQGLAAPIRRLAALLPEPAPGDAPPPPEDLATTVEARNGTIFFEDGVVDPPWQATLHDVAIVLRRAGGPQPRRSDVTVAARVDHASLQVAAELDPGRHAELGVRDLSLAALRPYLARVTGWDAAAGTLTLTSTLDLQGRTLRAPTRIVLDGVQLDRAGGGDPFAPAPGVPFDRALALAGEDGGPVVLDLALAGTLDAPVSRAAASVQNAFRDALADAATRPLRAPGAVTIASAAGGDALDPSAAETLDRLAVLLAHDPAHTVTLAGRSGDADVAVLRARAILDTLGGQADTPDRRALVDRLRATVDPTADPPPALTREQARQLAQLGRTASVAPGELAALAQARSARVDSELRARYPAARVRVADRPASGAPGVLVTIGTAEEPPAEPRAD